jgi:hypothetical protein
MAKLVSHKNWISVMQKVIVMLKSELITDQPLIMDELALTVTD